MSKFKGTLYITSNLYKNFVKSNIRILTRTMSTNDEKDVIIQDVNDKGVITLNRPKALNALNLSMVNKLYPILQQWQNEKTLVIIKGAGDKAFCAGGDVRAVVLAGLKGERLGHKFFRREYMTNGLIGHYKIPYIAFIDGIVMGGGVGLSIHGRYRIATERTIFAMPETQIGLFPDVGGSYFLPRLNGKLGLYLALTGYRLRGVDVKKAGIATHYCDSKNLDNIEQELLKCSNEEEINTVLEKYNNDKDENEFSLTPYIKQIDKCFNASRVEDIFINLEKDGSKWAQDTINLLKKMSPTSLKVTIKELQFGKLLNLQECLQMEYRLAVHCLDNKDFYEGVRALLIDKDQKPEWNPARLEDVTDALVNSHFCKLPDKEELKHKL